MTGGLRKRAHRYLNVPSATVGDGRLSFKARGILGYLLDKPAGWDVRSVAIAADSPDGKAAVQAGLRELAHTGYYRIERRRLLDGRLVTGTAVSEEPIASWAKEYAEYQGPVPVLQQADGSFKIQHKDGSLTGDGFTDSPGPQPHASQPEPAAAETAGDSDDSVCAGRTGARFPAPVRPVPGRPAPVQPVPENLAPLSIQKNHYRNPPPPPRPPQPADTAGAQAEGEVKDQDLVPGLNALVAQVRQIRPEWSSRSICRALAHPDVTERGWDRAQRAMLTVAAIPDEPARPARSRWPVVGPRITQAACQRAATVVRNLRRSYTASGLRPRHAASMPALSPAGSTGGSQRELSARPPHANR